MPPHSALAAAGSELAGVSAETLCTMSPSAPSKDDHKDGPKDGPKDGRTKNYLVEELADRIARDSKVPIQHAHIWECDQVLCPYMPIRPCCHYGGVDRQGRKGWPGGPHS